MSVIAVCSAFAQQQYTGVNSSAHGDIYNSLSNPADLLNSNSKIGIYLFSTDANLSNNKLSYSLDLKRIMKNLHLSTLQFTHTTISIRVSILTFWSLQPFLN